MLERWFIRKFFTDRLSARGKLSPKTSTTPSTSPSFSSCVPDFTVSFSVTFTAMPFLGFTHTSKGPSLGSGLDFSKAVSGLPTSTRLPSVV